MADLLQYIRKGRKNAVSRQTLSNLTGDSDRANRREIERLRAQGVPIISYSDGAGYWLAENVEELERFLREARRRTEAQQYPNLRKLAASIKGDKLVQVRAHMRRLKSNEIEGQVKL